MRKILTLLTIAILSQFSGCRKLADHFFHVDTSVIKSCRIVKIYHGDRTGIVYYNDHNDPDSVIFDVPYGSSGASYFYFIYNDHHQLIEYREDYHREPPGNYYYKHTYVYNNGIIQTDTTRVRQSGAWTELRTLHYDLNRRIIKEDRRIIEMEGQIVDDEVEPFKYTYDIAGNLEGQPNTYDDKINFLRTNKIWMFTQRNYSMNNPVGATAYNDQGLPLGFQPGSEPQFLFGTLVGIDYECEGK